MRATKESGFEWLGIVPENWVVSRIGSCAIERRETVSDTDFQPLSVTKKGVVPRLESAAKSDNSEGRKLIREGDFVINSRSDRKGSSGVSAMDGSCSVIYIVLKLLNLAPEYAHHLFRSKPFQEEFYKWGSGIVEDLWSTRYSAMKQIAVPVPPLAEQQAIAGFLDREIAQIDKLIAKQEQLITTLGERREEVVSRLSTQGIGGQSDLVESGIDWLPKIPSNWAPDKMSRIFKPKKGSNAAMLTAEYCGTVEGEYPVYSGQTSNDGVVASIESYEFESPDDGFIFTTTVGARAMSVSKIYGRFSLSQNCMILENKAVSRICTDFARWQLETMFSRKKSEVSSHMQPSFTMADLREYWMAIPSLAEQLEIVRLISSEVLGVEQLVKKSLKIVETLCERRQSLISAAVTGKIDLFRGA